MQTTPTAAATGSSLFSSIFGKNGQSAGGMFGLLMALFGQTGQNGLAAATASSAGTNGQNLPTSQLMQSTLANLLSGTDLAASGMTLDQAASQLFSMLQSLKTSGTQLSPALTDLLSGDQLDLATLKARLENLSDDTRDSVMGELAALLQPMAPAPLAPLPEATTEDGVSAVAVDSEGSKKQSAAQTPLTPLPAEVPDDALANLAQDSNKPVETAKTDTAPVAQTATQTATTAQAAAMESMVAQMQPTAPAPKKEENKAAEPVAEAETTSEQTLANLVASTDTETTSQKRSTKQAQRIMLGDTTQAQAQGITVAQAPAAAKPADTTSPVTFNAAEEKTTSKEAVAPVAASNKGEASLANLNDKGQQATADNTATAQATDKTATSFTDHLQSVKLNRTGAHIPVTDQLAVQMNKSIAAGQDRFTVRLNPAELGRIEVRVDMSSDGRVTASFHVDQPATLDLLQRDQRGLERALSDAGIKTDSSSLNFNLRGDGNNQRQPGAEAQMQNNSNSHNQSQQANRTAANDETPLAGVMEMTWYVGNDRLDVRV